MTWDTNHRWREVLPFSIGAFMCPVAFVLVVRPFGIWAFLSVVALAFPLIYVRLPYKRPSLATWPLFLIISGTVTYFTWNPADWQLHLLFVCILSLAIYCFSTLNEHITLVDTIIIVLVSLLGAAPIFQIPNGAILIENFRSNPMLVGFELTVCCVVSNFIVSTSEYGHFNRLFAWLLRFVVAACCLAMAFRTDALFIESTQYHWSYFVGPVQGVRAGGWLLWDVPSQYGLLPILLAAKLPFVSAWTSFYVFQGSLLFVCSLVMFTILLDLKVPTLPAGVAVIALFFLADPRGSIGPSPYPSSSAVRFVWCYVSLLVAARTFVVDKADVDTFVVRNTLPWLCALFWSAECAFYVSVISAFPLLMVFRNTSPPVAARLRQALKLITIPLCAVMIAIVIVVAIYGVELRAFPDAAMFVQYAVGYAGGFGAIPLSLASPIWLFFITLSLGFSTAAECSRASRNALGAILAAAGCILAIFSYYLSRAASDNITALLPLILVSLLIIIRADRFASTNFVRKSYSQAVISLAIASTLFPPKSLEAFKGAMRQPLSPAEKIEVADASLLKGIKEMDINAVAPVSYFGYAAVMPSLGAPSYATFEVPFVPTPPQSLEAPIPEAVRNKILRRHFCSDVPFGFYVEKLGDTYARSADWLRAIEQWYDPVKTYDDGIYRIIRFEKRLSACR